MKSSNQELAADKRPFTQVRSREMGATSGDAERCLRVPLNHLQSGKVPPPPPRGLRARFTIPAFVCFQGEMAFFNNWNLIYIFKKSAFKFL